jgi:hypothetical protein
VTRNLLHILQHSLGLDGFGQGTLPPYRRHFVAGGKDVDACRELVSLGYMTERDASEVSGGDPVFIVTKAGEAAVQRESPKPPRLTRGQERYRQWLDAATGVSFGEWLAEAKGRRVKGNLRDWRPTVAQCESCGSHDLRVEPLKDWQVIRCFDCEEIDGLAHNAMGHALVVARKVVADPADEEQLSGITGGFGQQPDETAEEERP